MIFALVARHGGGRHIEGRAWPIGRLLAIVGVPIWMLRIHAQKGSEFVNDNWHGYGVLFLLAAGGFLVLAVSVWRQPRRWRAAAIPALFYYGALFAAIHFNALRSGLRGIPKNELPVLGHIIVRQGHLFLPVIILLVLLLYGFTATYAAIARDGHAGGVERMPWSGLTDVVGLPDLLALEDKYAAEDGS